MRSYFYSLFRGLAGTHKLAIIHRDVKPANFLYDVTTGTGVLCDYGLAQKIGGIEIYQWASECLHSLPGPSTGGWNERIKATKNLQSRTTAAPGLDAGLHGIRLQRPLPLYEQVRQMEGEWMALRRNFDEKYSVAERVGGEWEKLRASKPWIMNPAYKTEVKSRQKVMAGWYKNWRPTEMVGNVNTKQERVGFLKEDRRSVAYTLRCLSLS